MLYTRNKPHKRKPNWRNILLTAVCVVLLGVSVTLLVKSVPSWLKNDDTQLNNPSATPSASPDPGSTQPSATPEATPDGSQQPSQSPEDSAQPSATPARGSGTQSVTVGAVGDILMHAHEYQAASTEGGYDFSAFFTRIQPYLTWQDLLIGNLETTIGTGNYDNTTAPAQLLTALKDTGFDVLTLANEHILDKDIQGAQQTVQAVNEAGLKSVGAYSNGTDYIQPLILTYEDLRIAVLNYTEATEQNPEGASDTVKYLNQTTFDNDMKQIQGDAQGVDFIIVYVHWGEEDESALTDAQKNWAQTFADAGVDVVLGSHTHLPQTLTYVQGKEGGKTLVAYGLGNFLGPVRTNGKDAGVILNFTLTKNFETGEKSIENVTYIPTWVLKYSSNGKYSFEIMSAVEYSEKKYQNMSQADRERVKAVPDEISKALGSDAGTLDENIRTMVDGVSTVVSDEEE